MFATAALALPTVSNAQPADEVVASGAAPCSIGSSTTFSYFAYSRGNSPQPVRQLSSLRLANECSGVALLTLYSSRGTSTTLAVTPDTNVVLNVRDLVALGITDRHVAGTGDACCWSDLGSAMESAGVVVIVA